MKKISLTKNKVALIDDEDYEQLVKYNWCFTKGYAGRAIVIPNSYNRVTCPKGKSRPVLMHRQIMNPPKGMEIDHRDGNGLNNQRSNLRLCTHSQNLKNQIIPKNNTSGYKGVRWNKPNKKWDSRIMLNGKSIHIGVFKNIQDAALAYNMKAKELFDEFAKINEIL